MRAVGTAVRIPAWRLALCVVFAAMVLVTSASADTVLRVAFGAIPKNLDPNSDPSGQMMPIYRLVFEGLVRPDPSGKPVPVLAESLRVINDTTWQFRLRRGVRFHNGEPFNAEVVKWNIEWDQNPKNSVYAARVKPIAAVEVVDEYTVNIKTKEPFASLPGNLMAILMLPPKHFQRVGRQGFSGDVVGTGPYRVTAFTPDTVVRMEANKQYWGKRFQITGFEFRMLPEASTRVAAVQAKEVDIAYDLPPESVDQLRAAGLKVMPVHIGQALVFVLDQPTTTIEPLKNRLVRQAINYAVDKDAIITGLTGGMARRLEGQLVGPDGFGYTDKVKAYPHDPGRARALLKEAGYATGFKVKMSGTNGRYPGDRALSLAVAQYLRQVGLDVDLSLLEANTWLDRYLNQKLDSIWIIGLNYLPSMDHTYASTHFSYESNRRFFRDDRFDELFRAQATALDVAKRQAALEQLAAYTREQAPVLFLHQIPLIVAVSSRVKEVTFQADYTMNLEHTTTTP